MEADKMNQKQPDNKDIDIQDEGVQNQQDAATLEAKNADNNKLQGQLDACKIECEQWKDKFVQVSADMQNYKRRVEKEQSMWTRRAQEDVLIKLLTIVDDFDRALAEHEKHERTPELDTWLEGFELIGKGLYKFLGNMNVVEIKQMKTFDPTLHEAIAQVDMPDKSEGDIVDVVQKGFMFGDEVLRPAKVTVAK